MIDSVITEETLIPTKDFGLVWRMHVRKASSETAAPRKSSGSAVVTIKLSPLSVLKQTPVK